MKYCILKSICTLIFTSFYLFAYAQTIVPGGDVSGIWSKAGSPYFVNGDISIPKDSTLEIRAGVTVEFQAHYKIDVQGRLLAVGTAMDSIRFTVSDTTGFSDQNSKLGGWNGIQFWDTDASQDSSIMMFCRLEYGKAVGDGWPDNIGGALTIINFDFVHITNNTFIHNVAGGLDAPAGGAIHLSFADVLLKHNSILENTAPQGGGIQMHMSEPTFVQNLVASNSASEGGGISMYGSLPTFSGDQFINNHAQLSGGGIFMIECGPDASFDNVYFMGNSANWGGGLGLAGCSINFTGCRFEENHVTWLGGAFAADYCNLTLQSCVFSKDTSTDTGGALHFDHDTIQIIECQFSKNSAVNGGAINSFFSSLEIVESTFEENNAMFNGGAMHVINSDIVSSYVNFDKNAAMHEGGGIYYWADSIEFGLPYVVLIDHTEFNNNFAGFNTGGALFRQPNGDLGLRVVIDKSVFRENFSDRNSGLRMEYFNDLMLSNSWFVDNVSGIRTSGAAFNSCTGTVSNSVFTGNSTPNGTTGCGITNKSQMHFMHCLFTGNSSGNGFSLHIRRGSEATLTNSILWNDLAGEFSLAATADSLPCQLFINNSLIQDGLDSIGVDSFSSLTVGAGLMWSDPKFEDAPSLDFHLSDDSPCIGSGIAAIEHAGTQLLVPSTDIEGNPRPNPAGSSPDIGPYESSLGVSTRYKTIEHKALNLRIFPNPVRDKLIIEAPQMKRQSFTIQMFTPGGALVAEFKKDERTVGPFIFLDLPDHLLDGLYLLKVASSNKSGMEKVMLFR